MHLNRFVLKIRIVAVVLCVKIGDVVMQSMMSVKKPQNVVERIQNVCLIGAV